jgi:MFS family permease
MILTVALITVGTLGLAATPGYATIGVAAPIIVVLCRLLQGFAPGGEAGPSTPLLIEGAPANRRGLYASWQIASQGIAAAIGGLFGVAISMLLTPAQLGAWGWRLPFNFRPRNVHRTAAGCNYRWDIARLALAILVVPAFGWLSSAPNAATLLGASALIAALTALNVAPALVAIPEMLPIAIRSTGLSVIYAIGATVFGGTTQFVITRMIATMHDPLAPAYYVVGTSLISLVAMFLLPETRNTDVSK